MTNPTPKFTCIECKCEISPGDEATCETCLDVMGEIVWNNGYDDAKRFPSSEIRRWAIENKSVRSLDATVLEVLEQCATDLESD